MSRYIKDSTGKLVKFANKLLYMLEHVYNEGVYYLRTIAGGGTVQNRGLVEDLYKLWEEQGRLDNIKVAILPQAGSVQRTSGLYRFFSRLFNLKNDEQLGNELNDDVGFDNPAKWTLESGITILDGVLSYSGVNNAKFFRKINNTISIVAGKKYQVSINVISGVANLRMANLNGVTVMGNDNNGYSVGRTTVVMTATVTAELYFFAFNTGVGSAFSIDDISIKEVLSGTNTDITQTTANSQPYFVNGAMVNPNGASRFMTHPTVSFGAGESWSMGTVIRAYVGGTYIYNTTGNYGIIQIRFTENDFRVLLGASVVYQFTTVSPRRFTDKTVHLVFVANGLGALSLYVNGVFAQTVTSTNTAVTFLNINNTTNPFAFSSHLHLIESGNPTTTQILEEYNLLRSYIPEIATTLIGTDEIATENCQMVATPMGRVISLNNLINPVEKIVNGEFTSISNWGLTGNWSISDGKLKGVNATSWALQTNVAEPDTLFKITVAISSYTSGILIFRFHTPDYFTPPTAVVWGVGTFVIYAKTTTQTSNFSINGASYAPFTGEIESISVQKVGFNEAQNAYQSFISQGSTVSNALLAAAMWRSPDSDLDKQAVFGKLFNGYAVQLLQMDIDAYNAANPSTPWGYHVMTRAEEQALALLDADTLKSNELWTSTNGTNETGLSLLGSGVINADGTYSDFGGKTRLMTGEGYALDVNDDGTSEEITVTTEGGILRLVKDLV